MQPACHCSPRFRVDRPTDCPSRHYGSTPSARPHLDIVFSPSGMPHFVAFRRNPFFHRPFLCHILWHPGLILWHPQPHQNDAPLRKNTFRTDSLTNIFCSSFVVGARPGTIPLTSPPRRRERKDPSTGSVRPSTIWPTRTSDGSLKRVRQQIARASPFFDDRRPLVRSDPAPGMPSPSPPDQSPTDDTTAATAPD